MVMSKLVGRRGTQNARASLTYLASLASLVSLVALLALLLFGSAAQAALVHPYTRSFGRGGVGSTSYFQEVQGVTVDQVTGDVYVLDNSEGGRVYKFDAAGEPADFSASGTNVITGVGIAHSAEMELAVDSSTGPAAGDVYIANNNAVRIYGADGGFLGELSGGEMCGVAVDPAGQVYVGIYPETVKRYAPAANPVTNAEETGVMGGLHGVCNIAADSEGDVYAATYSGGVRKYDALQFGSLAATGTLIEEQGRSLAVDPSNSAVFIDDGNRIAQYDGSLEPPTLVGVSGDSGASALIDSAGVAIDHASGHMYAGGSGVVEDFGPAVVVAGVRTEPATGATNASVTLHGVVEPAGGEITGCVFEYGTAGGPLDQTAACTPAPPYTGSAPLAVTATLTGLQGATAYNYRIAATDAEGTLQGFEAHFRTIGAVVSAGSAAGILVNAATLDGEVNPEGEATTYRVEYGTTIAYGASTPTAAVGTGEAPVAVGARVSGLQPATTYHFRFAATNGGGTNYGPDATFTTFPAGPLISAESFSEVGSSSLAVSAQISPLQASTSYRVEYGTSTAYGSSTQSTSIGTGEAAVDVLAHLEGLQPDTTYHFRFLATNVEATNAGADVTFHTHPLSVLGLPDGRGYEMVTPVDNEGAEPYVPQSAPSEGEDSIFTSYPSVASADGEALAYVGSPTSGGNGNQGNGGGNEYLAKRNPAGGWTQANIQPTGARSPIYTAFSSDLSIGVLGSTEPLAAGVTGSFAHVYARDNGNGSYRPLFTNNPPNRSARQFGVYNAGVVPEESLGRFYAGASADYRHMLFEANDALTSNAIDPGVTETNLYDSLDGELQLVNVLPDNSPAPNASFGMPASDDEAPVDYSHVISADGTRIFWTDLDTDSLYVRENDATTALIAAEAQYLTASTDGSKVLYTKAGDLYEEDLNDGVRSDLVPGGAVLGLAGAGDDLEYVYVVAEAALTSGAIAGQPNLYVLHAGTTKLIATLAPAGEETSGQPYGNGEYYPWDPGMGHRTAEVTPSGKSIVFTSRESLTGYDNVGGAEQRPALEVYVYDAESSALTCASCDPSGERPAFGSGAVISVSAHFTYQQRVISEDGGRVFFVSREHLLPQAVNGKTNVYEWERDGEGSCARPGGCVYLLSGGTSTSGSYLIDASADGDDVFIMTRARLTPEDNNEYNDIYDVRVGAAPPAATPQCTGSGCQGLPSPTPVFATPSSATFNGVGNFPPPAKAASKPKPKKAKKKATPKQKHKSKKSKKKSSKSKSKSKAKRAARPARRGANGRSGR